MADYVCFSALTHLRSHLKGCRYSVQQKTQQQGPSGVLGASIAVPWCGSSLTWQVLFNTEPPYLAPDFVFDDPSFNPLVLNPEPGSFADVLKRQLASWPTICTTSDNPTQAVSNLFAKIIQSILAIFKIYQLSRMEQLPNERLHFEISMLPTLVSAAAPAPTQATPRVDLTEGEQVDIDGSDVRAPRDSTPGVQGLITDTKAILSLPVGPLLDLSKAAPLTLTARRCMRGGEKMLPMLEPSDIESETQRLAADFILTIPTSVRGPGGIIPPQLPAWDPHSSLLEVLPQTVARVQQSVDTWSSQASLRNKVLECLCSYLGGLPVEVNLSHGTAQWSVTWDTCPFIITINCCADAKIGAMGGLAFPGQPPPVAPGPGLAFPDEKPLLMITNLRSTFVQAGVPATSSWYRDYPWSPRWSAKEMASRITAFLRAELPKLAALYTNNIPMFVTAGIQGQSQIQPQQQQTQQPVQTSQQQKQYRTSQEGQQQVLIVVPEHA